MNLWKSMSIYTASNLSRQAIGFILLPVITNYLSAGENGDLTTITSIVTLLGSFLILSAPGAINLEYFRQDQGKENFSTYISSALINPLILFFVLTLLSFVFGPALANWLEIATHWIYVIPLLALTTLLPQVLSIIYQARSQPLQYAAYNLSMTTLDLLFSILLIVGLSMNWEGRIIGNFGTKMLFGLIAFFLLYRSGLMRFKVNWSYTKDALFFGLPLILHILSANVMDLSDQLFIREMVGREELGVYSIGYKVGMIILILQAAMVMAWQPFLFKKLKEITPKQKKEIVQLSYLIMVGLVVAAGILYLISPLLFQYFVLSPEYQGGIKYVGIVALAYVFLGWYKMFSSYIIYTKNNKYLSYIAIFNIIFNLLLNYFLIKNYGTMGAAYATAISYFSFFVITAVVSQRVYPMPWLNPFGKESQ